MIFDFLKKQKEKTKKKQIIKVMIMSLVIPEQQKELYLEALHVLDDKWLDWLYESLTIFTKHIELKEIEDIKKNNFSRIAWMKKEEAFEKQKELNSFSFLINNL